MEPPRFPEPPEWLKKEKSTPRQSLLGWQEWGFLATDVASTELKDMWRYMQAMEQLIDSQEQIEVKAIEDAAKALSEEDRGELFMWHYPHHWNDVARTLFRASLISSLMSFLESSLGQICQQVRILVDEKLSRRDLTGNTFEKSRKYLERFGGFDASADVVWQEIFEIAKIRHVLIHVNGEIDSCNKPADVRRIIKKSAGLLERDGRIMLERQYLDASLKSADQLVASLSTEMRSLCDRCRQFDAKKRS